MKTLATILLFTISLFFNMQAQKTFHDYKVKTINGDEFMMSALKGKKVLVINVASKCGLTPQYELIQELYNKYGGDKFEIIGFPANNFLKQEPGSAEEIKTFCQENYGVTFPIMEKVSVSDYIYLSYPPDELKSEKTNIHPIYEWLTKKELNGVVDAPIQWNFQKFMIDEEGKLVDVLDPSAKPNDKKIIDWLNK